MSKINKTVPVEVLRERIEYRSDGNLYWKYHKDRSEKWNIRFANKPLTTFQSNGYVRFRIRYNGGDYNLRNHIVVWAIVKGEYPSKSLDHINNVRSDNRIENLREATHYQNSLNRPPLKNKQSQYKGLYWNKNKWRVQPEIESRKIQVGYFIDELEAATAYNNFVHNCHDTEFAYMNDITNGYTNKEYPNKPRGWKPE